MTENSQRRQHLLICVCLVLVTAAVYWPVLQAGFITLDDESYITENLHLRTGVTLRGLSWALTTPLDQWMPVTWVARLLEYQFFGLDAGAHHLINLVFHIANAVLLFGVLDRMTGARWRSALVAALFALHPLHVEPVAWVTGLKDVLSMFFGLLTIGAYVRYTELLNAEHRTSNVERRKTASSESPGTSHQITSSAFYFIAVILCALALMSKPMMVTLPFVLLLLDFWPLGRTPWAQSATGSSVKMPPRRLLMEKLPFFALTAASCVLTYWAQHDLGAMASLEEVPLSIRIANAFLSYVGYLGKMFWPARLAVFYPLHMNLSMSVAMVACVGLVGVTSAVIWKARRAPWLATGWFWYLGTLVPVIGLVQVGGPSMADRYTYFPLVGLFVMLCWSVPRSTMERQFPKLAVGVVAVASLAACTVLTRIQVGYWKNSETLFRRALSITRDNWVAHNGLGLTLKKTGRVQEAIAHFEQSMRLKPAYTDAHSNLGSVLVQAGRPEEAIAYYEKALRLNPDFPEAHYNLGVALAQLGRVPEAIAHLEHALRIRPDFAEARYNLGMALVRLGRVPEAIEQWEEALRLKPDYAEAHVNMGVALERAGRIPEAMRHYEEALRIKPQYAEAQYNLGIVLERAGRVGEALSHYEQALRINPNYAEAHNNLGSALARLGRVSEAVGHWEEALRINPNYARAHYNLGLTLEAAGRVSEAREHYEQALRINPLMVEAKNSLARLRSVQ